MKSFMDIQANTKMKAVFCTKYGPPEVLQTQLVDIPQPKNDEVLVKIMATAVNSGDVRIRGLVVEGFMKLVMQVVLGFGGPRHKILGAVLSGVIEKVGQDVKDWKAGDEVFAMTGMRFGAYAEYIVLKSNAVMAHKPHNATFEQAAAILFGGHTAIYFLQAAKIHEGANKKVLIYGASGSVGSSAIQIAKYYKAYVTAVCSGNGMALVKSLGANETLDYTKENFVANGIKYDIIFDAVGKIKKKDCKGSLKENGKFVTVGGLDVAKQKKAQLLLLKALYESNQLDAAIDRIYNLDEIVEAHRYVDTGRKKGNVVIRMPNA
jgi:NADPH:quinone reductase-like Zn-dependent oxidoreductase